MKVTDLTRARLRYERERRKMVWAGYSYHEPHYELVRGFSMEHRIVDVQISEDGKGIWTKTSDPRIFTPCNAIKNFQCCRLQKYHEGEHKVDDERQWIYA